MIDRNTVKRIPFPLRVKNMLDLLRTNQSIRRSHAVAVAAEFVWSSAEPSDAPSSPFVRLSTPPVAFLLLSGFFSRKRAMWLRCGRLRSTGYSYPSGMERLESVAQLLRGNDFIWLDLRLPASLGQEGGCGDRRTNFVVLAVDPEPWPFLFGPRQRKISWTTIWRQRSASLVPW